MGVHYIHTPLSLVTAPLPETHPGLAILGPLSVQMGDMGE